MNIQLSKRRKWLIIAMKVLISAGILVWIVSRANLADIIESLSHANVMWLLLAACSPAIGILIMATRWRGLLRAQGVHASLPQLVQSCFVAGFARQFLPSTIGGDAVRGYDSWKLGASKSVAITTLFADRLLGLLALVLFAVVALLVPNELTRGPAEFRIVVLIVAGGLFSATWLIFAPTPKLNAFWQSNIAKLPKTASSTLEKVLVAVTAYQGKTNQLVRAFGLSLLLQANVVTFYYLIGRAMGFSIPYHLFYLIVPIAVIVMLMPISINGIGIRESIFVYLLGMFAVDSADAVAFAWLEHGLFLLYGVVGGIVFALGKSRTKAEVAANEAAERAATRPRLASR